MYVCVPFLLWSYYVQHGGNTIVKRKFGTGGAGSSPVCYLAWKSQWEILQTNSCKSAMSTYTRHWSLVNMSLAAFVDQWKEKRVGWGGWRNTRKKKRNAKRSAPYCLRILRCQLWHIDMNLYLWQKELTRKAHWGFNGSLCWSVISFNSAWYKKKKKN